MKFLERLTRRGPAKDAGARLYAAAVAKARAPAIYLDLAAPDTPDGRFEIYTLHILMLLERLKREGRAAKVVSQAVFDAYLSGLDHGLRELAVGDLSVGKAMRKLGEAFYGRAKGWDEALAALPDRTPLETLLGRTVFGGRWRTICWRRARGSRRLRRSRFWRGFGKGAVHDAELRLAPIRPDCCIVRRPRADGPQVGSVETRPWPIHW